MRISPKQLLQGLLYTTPVLLLALASCGGGGGSSGSTPPLAAAYTLSVNVTGISGVSAPLVLRNGGDDLSFSATGTQHFAHQVLSGSKYNISATSQPTATTTQLCTFDGTGGSTSLVGTMPAQATTVGVSCANAYKISVIISNLTSDGLVLQNNDADNYQVASDSSGFTFSTPVAANYRVTILKQPLNPAVTCSIPNPSANNITTDTSVAVTCAVTSRLEDPYVYATNSGFTNNAYAFKSTTGTLSTNGTVTQGSGRAAIAAVGGKYVLIASGGWVASYSIGSAGALTKASPDVATGNTPIAIAVHPLGKFAYVVNEVSNSISAYNIDSNGTLASIDADGRTTANEPTIRAGDIPFGIVINPAGTYAYVVNGNGGICNNINQGCITVFSIDANGALKPVPATAGGGTNIATGISPSSIAIDPTGKYVYVTNFGDNFVSEYAIASDGTLTSANLSVGAHTNSIAISPDGQYAYVAFRNANQVQEYGINGSGAFTFVAATAVVTGSLPSSVSIDSSGTYAYIANNGTNTVAAYLITGGSIASTESSNIAITGPVAVITAPLP